MSYNLDKLDKEILSYLLKDARKPYTEIAKELIVSPGTIHVRMKKMEQAGIVRGTSLSIDYSKLGYSFIAYVGVYLNKSSESMKVINRLKTIPEVTIAHLATGRFGIFCKIRCRDAGHAKDVIFAISDIEGVNNTESMISLEECINSNERLIGSIIDESER